MMMLFWECGIFFTGWERLVFVECGVCRGWRKERMTNMLSPLCFNLKSKAGVME